MTEAQEIDRLLRAATSPSRLDASTARLLRDRADALLNRAVAAGPGDASNLLLAVRLRWAIDHLDAALGRKPSA